MNSIKKQVLDKDKIVEEVIDNLEKDKVKLAEFKAGFIDHVYLMEKTIDLTFSKVREEIEKDIALQKKKLKDGTKYFEENKPFMWRIHGFQSLLSRITGEEVDLLLDAFSGQEKVDGE